MSTSGYDSVSAIIGGSSGTTYSSRSPATNSTISNITDPSLEWGGKYGATIDFGTFWYPDPYEAKDLYFYVAVGHVVFAFAFWILYCQGG